MSDFGSPAYNDSRCTHSYIYSQITSFQLLKHNIACITVALFVLALLPIADIEKVSDTMTFHDYIFHLGTLNHFLFSKRKLKTPSHHVIDVLLCIVGQKRAESLNTALLPTSYSKTNPSSPAFAPTAARQQEARAPRNVTAAPPPPPPCALQNILAAKARGTEVSSEKFIAPVVRDALRESTHAPDSGLYINIVYWRCSSSV